MISKILAWVIVLGVLSAICSFWVWQLCVRDPIAWILLVCVAMIFVMGLVVWAFDKVME